MRSASVTFSNVCVILLAVIALVVFIGQWRKKNMWLWIVAYWYVLTAKNINDGWRLF